MAQQIKTLAVKASDSVLSPKPTWKKERTDFHMLSSDLHTHAEVDMNLHTLNKC